MSSALWHARWAVAAAAVWMLAACASFKPKIAPPPAPPPPLDASYDWHVLLVAPFGSVLKDIPLALHEVLVFRDEERSASPADDLECYAANGAAPRFMTRTPSSYLLCFNHGKLSRIEATVRLPQNESALIVADACALWTKNAQAPSSAGSGSAAASDGADACAGADGGVAFAARLEDAPNEEDTQLTMQLDASDR
ncbi:MAG TPA: hypothetical protein VE058_13055 [Steroidobacteraceae bacterium]|nr:hypothetical protein [Steroidobacteraceae bacterium]